MAVSVRLYGVGLYGAGLYGVGDTSNVVTQQVFPSLFTDSRGNRFPRKDLYFPPTRIR